MENGNDNNVSTTGQNKQQKDQNKQAKGNNIQKKVKDAKKIQKGLKFVIANIGWIAPILIASLIIIYVIGIIGLITSLPGLWVEKAYEFGKNLWAGVTGFVTGDTITPTVTEEDQIALAQHIQEMGYDIVGYGFADTKYEYDDEENVGEIDGYTNGTITGLNQSVDGRNYLQAYIAQSEAIYVPSTWSISGFFKSISSFVMGEGKNAKAYSEGMLNIKENSLLGVLAGSNVAKPQIAVNREEKLLRISMNRTLTVRDIYYFNLDNWTARYGKPLELFLSLHLSTMMPDLAYDLATEDAFNTKVNINLQLVSATFKVIFDQTGDGEDPLTQEDIEKEYLKIMCNMSDTEIDRFVDAGKLDDAFEKLLKNREQHPNNRFNLYDGAVVDTREEVGTSLGTNLAKVEEELLGQKYSTYNITEIRARTVYDPITAQYIEEVYTVDVVQDKILRCLDVSVEEEKTEAQSRIDDSILAGITVDQSESFSKLILDGRESSLTYLPRITSVDNHWYYSYVNFVYGKAEKAKKKIDYIPASEDDPLTQDNLNGGKIILDQTFVDSSGAGGVYYQLCEPEVDGPNDAIVALFKGGSGEFNGESYNFSAQYYRYDGTRSTALKIANAKAIEAGKSEFTFQNEDHYTQSIDNSEWEVTKEPVSFATEDEDGNKSYTNAFTAFAILENTHTEEAEWVYRNLKDLLVKLRYFSKANFEKPLNQILLWPIESVGSDNIAGEDDEVTNGIEKEENEYGIFLREGRAFGENDGVLASGDAIVQSVEGDTIRLKFKSLSTDVINELKEKFGSDYSSPDSNIILDMEMTIKGVNPLVTAGTTVTRGETIATTTNGDIRIVLYNVDKSIVDDIETYMYPTYEGTEEDDFNNGRPNSGNDADEDYDDDNENNDEGEFDPDYVIENIEDAPRIIYQALRQLGCTKAGACGALGNIKQESGFNPSAQNPNSTAYGLIQWTRSSGRRANLEAWCAQNGKDYRTFDGQLGFFLYELQGYSTVWNKLTTSNDVIECADIFARRYEGCTADLYKRKTYANAFMLQMAD